MPKALPDELRKAIVETLREFPDMPIRAVGRKHGVHHSTVTGVWEQLYFAEVARDRIAKSLAAPKVEDRSEDIIRRARDRAASRRGVRVDDGDAKDLAVQIVEEDLKNRYLEVRRWYERAVVCSDVKEE